MNKWKAFLTPWLLQKPVHRLACDVYMKKLFSSSFCSFWENADPGLPYGKNHSYRTKKGGHV